MEDLSLNFTVATEGGSCTPIIIIIFATEFPPTIRYRIWGCESCRPYPQRKQCARDARKQTAIHISYFPLQAEQADKVTERSFLRRPFGNDRSQMAPVRLRKATAVKRREEGKEGEG